MKLRKWISGLLVAVMCFASCGALVGCFKKDPGEDTVVIEIFNGGYGIAWLDKIVAEFKKDNPEINVETSYTYEVEELTTRLLSGPKGNPTDIFFSKSLYSEYILKGKTSYAGVEYPNLLADITDIYSANVPGESITMAKKMQSDYSSLYSHDGKYYATPWASGMVGLIYNTKIFGNTWALPRTTNELLKLMADMKKAEIIPYVYSLSDSYWEMLWTIWWAQYEGKENYLAFNGGYDPDGNRYTPEIVTYNGILESLKVLNNIMLDSNGYAHPHSKSINFTTAQNYFLEGKAAMMPNGDWIEREMMENYTEDEINIAFMRTPIISSITDKLTTIKDEATLLAAIDYVDGKKDAVKPIGASEEDLARIAMARKSETSMGAYHTGVIPAYSNAIPAAKKFLQYMATDKALKIYAQTTKGATLPYNIDYFADSENAKSISKFQKTRIDIMDDCNIYLPDNKNSIFALGGLSSIYNDRTLKSPSTLFSASNANDYMSPEKLFTRNYEYVSNKWTDIKRLAGL